MAGFSDYLEDELLDHVLSNAAFTSPTTVYCALYTAAPSDAGGGTEVTGGSYAREAISFGAASSGSASNDTAVTFTTATASWGTVTHVGIFDASTAGNLLAWAALGTSKAIGIDDTANFAIGDITVTLD
jgi:hypothetical protein